MNKEQLQEMVELREKVAALRKALEGSRYALTLMREELGLCDAARKPKDSRLRALWEANEKAIDQAREALEATK